jgi:type IV pilus assembly protein PilB
VTSPFDSTEGAATEAARLDRPRTMPRIGEMMIARGLITHEQLETALDHQRASGQLMGEILVDLGHLDAVDLTRILAERRGYQFVDLRNRDVDLTLMNLVPEEVARRYSALPLANQDDHVVVAMAQPENVFALDDLRVLTELPVFPVMAEPNQILDAITRCYRGEEYASNGNGNGAATSAPAAGPAPRVTEAATASAQADSVGVVDDAETVPAVSTMARAANEHEAAVSTAPAEDPAIVNLVSVLFEQAIRERASDVHIDALSDRLRVRFRVDGVLREVTDAPLEALHPLMARVRTLAGFDVGRTRVPREGHFSITADDRVVDVRLTILPTGHEESCVLRISDRESSITELDGIGLTNAQRQKYTDAIRKPRGLIVVSGPTGSGRTATLYATLHTLNMPERSIGSVEDPVAYHIDGITQLAVDELAAFTFPTALRLLRHSDPEVIVVDELRERDTAAIATDAAVAGNLVLAALHTTSAAAVPGRLLDMGVDPYLVTAGLTCVVGQRLVRTLCASCAAEDVRSRPLLQKLGCADDVLDRATLRTPIGCEECRGSGYIGRRGVFEVMPVTETIAHLIADYAPEKALRKAAVAEGMEPLRTAALNRALAGETSLEEVLRAIA